jgi:hypothetical protein
MGLTNRAFYLEAKSVPKQILKQKKIFLTKIHFLQMAENHEKISF